MGIIDGKKLPTDVQQWKCKVIGCIMKRPFKLAVHGLLDLSIHAKQHGWWNPHCQPLYSPGANSSDFGRLSRNWLKYEPCMTSIRLSALFAYLGTYILISSFYSFFLFINLFLRKNTSFSHCNIIHRKRQPIRMLTYCTWTFLSKRCI